MAAETNTGLEMKDMAKVWKEVYLKGLETSLQWQQQNEQLVKQAVLQGLAAYHQWVGIYNNWLWKPWDQVQGQTTRGKLELLTHKEAVMGRKSRSTSRSPMQRKRNRSRGRNAQRRHLRKAA